MPLTDQQSKAIKAQLLQQISKLPAEQQAQIKAYISQMNAQQLEEFLIKNKLIQPSTTQAQPTPTPTAEKAAPKKLTKKQKEMQECVFCALSSKKMPSLAIYEDEKYLAALEINPFNEGHTILIPKKHIKQTKSLPSKALSLANKIGKHIVKKLKAQSFQVSTSNEMGHSIINIIPIYKKKPLTFERKKATQQELQEIAIKIGQVETKKKPKTPKISKTKAQKAIIKLPRRIP